jgi:P-type Cu+ transporter
MMTRHQDTHNVTEDVDPVCGMTITPEDAVGHVSHEGRTYYFCSQSCLDRFRADSDEFLKPTKAASVQAADGTVEYMCPMHPEVRQHRPGACPKCGRALEPVTYTPPITNTEWTCPMHPEIVRDEPGSCPICGMALDLRVVTVDARNPELDDMTRRFQVSLALSVPILAFICETRKRSKCSRR